MRPETLLAFVEGHPSKVITFGIPVDANSSHTPGAAMAPWEIKRMLFPDAGNVYSEDGVDLSDPKDFASAGVLQYEEKTWFEDIEKSARIMAEFKRKPIFIGGDHSITFPILSGLAKHHKDLTVLHIDAHPDLYDEYQGNKFSHASPFARIMENKLVKRLIQIGVRSMTPDQRAQVKKFGVECHEMKNWMGYEDLKLEGPVYMSIDLDGLDPTFAPGVSHPVPGGLLTREVLDLIHGAGPGLIGADVVEYNPTRDINGMTANVAAYFVRELAGAMLLK